MTPEEFNTIKARHKALDTEPGDVEVELYEMVGRLIAELERLRNELGSCVHCGMESFCPVCLNGDPP